MIARYYPRGKFIILNVLGFISSAENIALAFMVGGLTNIALSGHIDQLPLFVTEVAIFLVVVLVSQLGYNHFKNDAIRYTNQVLREKVLRGMFTRAKSDDSDNLGFLTNDFKLLETNRFGAELDIAISSFTLVLSLGYALYINWGLTLIYFVGSCIPFIASNFFQKPIQKASEEWSSANSKYVSHTKNFLSGAQTINLYHQEDNAVRRNTGIISRLESSLMRMNVLNANTQTIVSLVAEFATFLIPFVIGVVLIINHYATIGTLFAVMQLPNSFVNPILQILSERNNLSTTKSIVEKVNAYISAHEDSAESKNSPLFKNSMTFRNISLNRDGVQLASGIDIALTQGKKIAIIGPSGCGKSTLLQFIMSGQNGTAQEIDIDGTAVEAGTCTQNFAYASQSPVIFADSLEFNLTLGAHIDHATLEDVCERLQLSEVVRDKGFDYSLGENADQLSGGQLARIDLARAILSERPILLLDEINASLDHKTAEAVHRYLLDSNLTFIEVIHHYQPGDLAQYDEVIDFGALGK